MTISTIYFKAEKIDQHCFSWTTFYQNNVEKRLLSHRYASNMIVSFFFPLSFEYFRINEI